MGDLDKKRYTRKKADETIEALKVRLKEVNKKNFMYNVDRCVIFGSYVNTENEYLGDLDVAIHLKIKPKYENDEFKENCRRYEKVTGKSAYAGTVSLLKAGIFGKEEIAKFLKNKQLIISMHLIDGIQDDVIFSKKVIELM